jgi:DNA replication protein DnaC
LKTVDDFDFTFQTTLQMSMFGTFVTPDFVSEGGCLVLLSGKPVRGKTPRCCGRVQSHPERLRRTVTTAAALIDDLSVAARDGQLRDALEKYVQPSVLVSGELGPSRTAATPPTSSFTSSTGGI